MELWEFVALQSEWIKMQEEESRNILRTAWLTAKFSGSAFAGKLRKLETYMHDAKRTAAPKVSRDEFDLKLAKAKGGNV
jgi:hypothetical protein